MVEKAKQFILRHQDDSNFNNAVADYLIAFASELEEKSESPEDFQMFWNLYNVKRAKPKCLGYWNKLSSEDRKKAIDNIAAYKKYCTITGRAMLDPQGYLNPKNRRFEDEYPNLAESTLWAEELLKFFEIVWRPKYHPYQAPDVESLTLDIYRLRCTYNDIKLAHLKGVAHYIIDVWSVSNGVDFKPYINPTTVAHIKRWPQRRAEAEKYFMKYS